MDDIELDAAMAAMAAVVDKQPDLLQGTDYKLSPATQKIINMKFMRDICEVNPQFLQDWLAHGKNFWDTVNPKDFTTCFGKFGLLPALARVGDRTLKNYLLQMSAIAYILGTELTEQDVEKLASLVRKLDKNGYIVILMEVVAQFFPESYQPLVDFINVMATQPRSSKVVVTESAVGGGAVGGGTVAESAVGGVAVVEITIFNGAEITREDLLEVYCDSGKIDHVDHNCQARAKDCKSSTETPHVSFIRFSTTAAVLPPVEFKGAHLTSRLLTNHETRAYLERIEKESKSNKVAKMLQKAQWNQYIVIRFSSAPGSLLNEAYRLTIDGQIHIFFGDKSQALAVAKELGAVVLGEKEQKAVNSRLHAHLSLQQRL